MTRRTWPATLELATAEPVMPRCPISCCFRLTCPTWVQDGIVTLWTIGRITAPADCVHFAHLADVHRETTGREPPASAEALIEQLAERKAIAEEGAP